MTYSPLRALQEARSLERMVRSLPVVRRATEQSAEDRQVLFAFRDSIGVAAKLIGDLLKVEDPTLVHALRLRCVEQLDVFQQALVQASGLDMLSPVDAAHLSALGDQLAEKVKVS